MTALRVVTDTDGDPLDHGEAHEAITRCWQAARSAYVAAIGIVGEVPLRQLAEPGDGGYQRWHVAHMRDRARALAECATRMADELDRAVDAFDRAHPVVRPQRRRRMTRKLLREVAEVYRSALAEGEAPTVAVREHFTVSHSTAARWVGEARKAGELGPAVGPTPGEVPRTSSTGTTPGTSRPARTAGPRHTGGPDEHR